ncbi:MAG: HAD family phosphatase [Candidatus Dadabacteria bacterium]|nr:MAG: HAD family phosphatase [Candidatus Dadabacteria bacterium]
MEWDAILFDFDGVIGKSVEDNFIAWKMAFEDYGLTLKPQDYFMLEGKRSPEIIRELLKDNSLSDKELDAILALKDSYYAKHNSFQFYEGAEDLVNYLLTRPIKLALVSGGSRKRIYAPQSRSLVEKFHTVITGEDCTETKPSPAPYLEAACRLKVEPQRCLVVENAPLGIKSAKRAGMYCIALCSTLDKSYLGEADLILDNISELYRHLSGAL